MSKTPKTQEPDSQVKQALRALEKMQSKLDSLTRARTEAIAVIGVACRFPGASDPESFWRLLTEGVDAIREVPRERWDIEALYDKDPDAAGKMYTRWCGLLDNVDQFDPAFFGISPREAVSMDPQQRLLLEVTWEALERAAYTPERLAASPAGVYVGASSSDYARHQFADLSKIDAYAGSGVAHSILANRLSYFLDLQGPSMALDTACSSSLVAVHLACQSLRSGECQVAFAGGVNLILSPEPSIIFSRARMMAADGRCKTFDSRADGYVRGEGCGVVVLKRLSVALTDGDPIWAVIRGSAVNQDGRSNGLAAPNLLAQQRVIRQALASGNIEPRQVGYVEAHGTGTALGDPIEVEALSEIYGKPEAGGGPCLLASVKTNIGHLEAAAGIAGLIKAVLCLQHREIPPHLHLRTLNPNISFDRTRFAIPTERRPWPGDSPAPLAAVSSFGFGGTNAHIILDAAPAAAEPVTPLAARPYHLLAISAKSSSALKELAARYERFLESSDAAWPDVCATANAGRAHFPHRLTVTASTAGEAREQLAAYREGQTTADVAAGHSVVERSRVGFLFTGQGSQYCGMGRQLYETDPTFRNALDRCAAILDGVLERPLFEVLFASPADEALHRTTYTQPALFALEWSLAQLWMTWGIQPDCLLGHSLGELVAACVSGVFSLEDGLRLVAARGRLTERHALRGALAAIFADSSRVRSLIAGLEAVVVAENSPSETVIGGAAEPVAAAVNAAERAGLRTRALPGSVAFHSPLMDPVLGPFADAAADVRFDAPRIPLISNRTGRVATREELCDSDYWVHQLREPVRFSTALQTLVDRGVEALIEIGPHPTLLNIQQQAYPDAGIIGLPSLRKGTEDWRQLLKSLSQNHLAGGRVNWKAVDQHYTSKRVALPTYPFQRSRYWLDLPPAPSRPAPFYRLEWRIQPEPQPDKSPSAVRWILRADGQGVAAALAEQLAREGADVTLISGGVPDAMLAPRKVLAPLGDGGRAQREPDSAKPQERRGEVAQEPYGAAASTGASRHPLPEGEGIVSTPTVVLDFSSLDVPGESPRSGPELVATLTRVGGSVLRSIQSSIGDIPAAKIWLITQGAQVVNGHPAQPALQQAPVWGFGRVLAHEHPGNWGGLIDLDPAALPAESAELLAKLIVASGREDQWVVRGRECYAARLERYAPAASASLKLDAPATYLISGGLGEIGLCMAEWLASRGARHVALLGRRAAAAAQQARVELMRQSGIDVLVFEADVADPVAVERVLKTIAGGPAPLRGVIHCAGVLDDGVILSQDESRLARVLAPKAGGAWELHVQTAGSDLQFFVLCSSVAGILGSPGQSAYAAANVFLDALALSRRAAGMPALSVQWGPWNVGMSRGVRRALPGLGSIEPPMGLAMLEQLLAGPAAEAAALDVNWAELLRARPELAEFPLLALIADQRARTDPPLENKSPDPRPAPMFEQFAAAPAERRAAVIRAYLEQRIKAVLRSSEPVADTENILDLGMDSLMVVEVLNDCRRDLQIALYPREMYALPNFGALAQYLAREFERTHGREKSVEESAPSAIAMPVAAPGIAVGTATKRNRGIVFLLSSPRSGSTLLRVMLAGHPAFFSPPELHLLSFDSMRSWHRTLAPNYLTEGLQRALMELMPSDAAAARSTVQAMVDEDRPVQQVYAMLQDLAGARMLVDKSPAYGTNLETLRRAEALFDGARYIHLVRHPYAVIESFVRNRMDKIAGIETQDPFALAEQAWTTMNGNIRRFLQEIDPERHHLIKYEDLVTDPFRGSRDLCEFLAVPFEPAMLKPYEGARMTDGVHSRSLPIGDPAFLSHSEIDPKLADAWRSVELPRGISQPGKELADAFGYTLAQPKARPVDAPPSVGGPAGSKEAAERRTDGNRPVGPTLSSDVGGPADSEEAAERRTDGNRPVGPTLNSDVGGPAGSKEAAERRTDRNRPVGPTLNSDVGGPAGSEEVAQSRTERNWTEGSTLSSVMQETWLEVRGVRLCLCMWGPEDGPLVLCLHGILEHGAAWELVATRLASRGLRVVAPDLRGHGRSDHAGKGESYHLLDFLADIDGIARSFAQPLRLVGHSMGAALAAMYASARPQQVCGLVLVEPPSSMKSENGGMADLLAVQLDHLSKPQRHPVFSDVAAAAQRLCLATPSLPSSVARRAAERLTESCEGGVRWRWDPRLRTRAGLAFDGATLTPGIYAEMLARIAAPTTLVYGDGTHPGSEAARDEAALAMPSARRLLLAGGHHLHFEAADELANAIAECPVTC